MVSFKQDIAALSLVVLNYDDAIDFYTNKLGFTLIEDSNLGNGKRWVQVCPQGSTGCTLLLAKAANEQQRKAIGQQAAGRVFLFLHTDNFYRDYTVFKSRGVAFLEEPRIEAYGTVAVFADLYGNKWDLLEPKNLAKI